MIPVFVGNISFDTTEEMVRDVFAEVGPVVAVRLVNSKDSGKPKGYGFVEFADMATAESAVRNLNGRELAGRALRVDFAEHPDGSRVVVGTRRGARAHWRALRAGLLKIGHTRLRRRHPHRATLSSRRRVGHNCSGASRRVCVLALLSIPPLQPFGLPAAQAAAAAMAAAYGAPPPGAPGGAAPGAPADLLTLRLSDLSPRQMYEIMAQTKALASANPGQARALLTSNPQLTRALFQAQLLLGMVRSPADGAPVSSALPTAPVPMPQQHTPLQPPMHAGLAPPAFATQGVVGYSNVPPPQHPWLGGAQPPGLGDAFSSGMPSAHAAVAPSSGFVPAPSPHGQQQPASWAPVAPPQLPGPLAGMDVAQQQALLAQVIRLSDAQVLALPEAEQEQVRMLQGLARQHLAAGQQRF